MIFLPEVKKSCLSLPPAVVASAPVIFVSGRTAITVPRKIEHFYHKFGHDQRQRFVYGHITYSIKVGPYTEIEQFNLNFDGEGGIESILTFKESLLLQTPSL